VNLVGFIIRIYHDARSPERQNIMREEINKQVKWRSQIPYSECGNQLGHPADDPQPNDMPAGQPCEWHTPLEVTYVYRTCRELFESRLAGETQHSATTPANMYGQSQAACSEIQWTTLERS